jgi:hypothetical protein
MDITYFNWYELLAHSRGDLAAIMCLAYAQSSEYNEKSTKLLMRKLNINHIPYFLIKNRTFVQYRHILVCNYKQLIELVNDGYWFLNCEFIDFNLLMNSNEVKGRRILNKSVEDSVNFLLEIFELNSKDLNKTNEYIRDKFSYKMQNNYKIFNETIYDIKIQDEIMDFILEPSHSKII